MQHLLPLKCSISHSRTLSLSISLTLERFLSLSLLSLSLILSPRRVFCVARPRYFLLWSKKRKANEREHDRRVHFCGGQHYVSSTIVNYESRAVLSANFKPLQFQSLFTIVKNLKDWSQQQRPTTVQQKIDIPWCCINGTSNVPHMIQDIGTSHDTRHRYFT